MKGREPESGSLDMLLDTMCNTFGGVCFLTLMVSLISMAAPKDGAASAETESALAAHKIEEREKAGLLRRRDELRNAIAIQQEFVSGNSTGVVVRADLIRMSEKLASDAELVKAYEKKRIEYLDELAKLKTSVSYSRREAARLSRLVRELEDRVGKPIFDRHRVVRTPKERKRDGLRTIDVWLHRHRLYLLDSTDGSVEVVNRKRESGRLSWDVRLVDGKGLLIDDDFFQHGTGKEWVRVKQDIGPNSYVRIFTDTVSFSELCLLRDALISRNSMYNWIVNEENVIHFVEGYDGRVQ